MHIKIAEYVVRNKWKKHQISVFTARCTLCKARYCYCMLSVCLPAVGDCDHIRWVSSKLESNYTNNYLRGFAPRSPTSAIVFKGNPQNLGGLGVASLFLVENLRYFWNGARWDQTYY